MLISTHCVNRITVGLAESDGSGIGWKGGEPARERLSFRADTPDRTANSVHSRPRFRGGELQRESRTEAGSPQRGPRDASVAGCPSRGRAERGCLESVGEYHLESRSNEKDVKGVHHGAHGKKDHALPVVRYAGRRGGKILRFRVQEFEDRQDQPLWKRGIRGSRQEGRNGDDRGVRNRRAKVPGPERRAAFQVQRGGVVPGAL